MTSTGDPAAAAGRRAEPGPDGTRRDPSPAIGPPRLRGSRARLGAATALVATGGLLAAWLYVGVARPVPVLALREDVARGEPIAEADLVTARLPADPLLATVPADRLPEVVGHVAAVDLPAGSLLTGTALAEVAIPAPGESLVVLTLPAARLPGSGLRAGDRVRVVDTPRPADDPPAVAPAATGATVVHVSPSPATGEVVVDLAVPSQAAAGLAARVATTRVAVVVDGPSGTGPDGDAP